MDGVGMPRCLNAGVHLVTQNVVCLLHKCVSVDKIQTWQHNPSVILISFLAVC